MTSRPPILMGQPEVREDKAEVVVGGKRYEIDREVLGENLECACRVEVKVDDGFSASIKVTEGLVLGTDTFRHFCEAVAGNARNMTLRVLKQWLAAGHEIRGDKDLEGLYDRYKKTILDKMIADKILEETK